MVLLGDEAQVEAHFGDSVNLDARLSTVCAEHTVGLEIVLDTPIELLDDKAQGEACFSPFGDNADLDAR
jgi:hypothetical protein